MSLSNELKRLCILHNISIAVMESCTGGNIASEITSVPGSSSYFKGGIVAYQNEAKINILGLSEELVSDYSEVSSHSVKEMAVNVLNMFNVDFSIATSGYAGPEGGTDLNPVGTVFVAIAYKDGVMADRFSFSGNRKSITGQAVQSAFELLLSEIKKIK